MNYFKFQAEIHDEKSADDKVPARPRRASANYKCIETANEDTLAPANLPARRQRKR